MLCTPRSALATLLLGFAFPSLSAACSFAFRPARPIGCAESVTLSVAVDGALYPGERGRAGALERRLRAKAIQKLGENRIAVDDPEGQDLRLEILESVNGGVLVAISSNGAETNDFTPDAERLESERNALTEILPAEILAGPGDLERVALDIFDQAISGNWRADCDLSRALSANGRFAFELPPSHPEARDRYLSRLADDGVLDLSAPSRTGSLFERSADGEEERLSTFRLAEETLPERFLVADDGRFVVAFDLRETQSQGAGFDRGRTLIYRSDGSVVSRLTIDDLLTSGDAQEIRRTRISSDFLSPLSASLDDDRNLLVLALADGGIPHEIAIDLETGRPLTPRRDLLPQMRVTISSSLPTGGLEPAWNPPACVGEIDASEVKLAFAPELAREHPLTFYDHSIERPLPAYTEIAKRARLQGTVEVEVVVSETGRVSCARVTRLPMGLDKSAEAVALRWRFQPFVLDGKPVRAIGRFSFYFGLTEPSGAL